ncbi:MAG: mannose-1-phosphate guanylyltransferase/mannose-6-phosphate isomerase [Beijerinckiaceae bacterium]|nr:mannose-1-phosphate guanylyltransferase/mannose-6-phosphate isomerase [Beijerinckiaceae bacterium]
MTIRPLIMCGGSGARLWPLSRESFPKQFAPLIGKNSTFQETLLRMADKAHFGRPLIVAAKRHRFMVERQLAEIGIEADLLLEPMPRDSGPAIAAGAALIARDNPDQLVMVLAADHVVRDAPAFRQTVLAAASAAEQGYIVTFGIQPSLPATGYGYIEQGEPIAGSTAVRVRRFVEKPDLATAQRYLLEGYLWNSGNFLFKASALLDEYRRFSAESLAAIEEALDKASSDLGAPVLDAGAFERAQKKSIDYQVMEKTDKTAVLPCSFGWSDIGTWDAMWEISDKDDHANVAVGEVELIETSGSYASTDGPLVGVVGMKDTVVVATRDAVLVCDKSRAGEVKTLVDKLRKAGVKQASDHERMYRPWGWYQTLELQGRFQVKRIVVYPGGRLSLQKHFHRAEHWVVVRGAAQVTVGDRVELLNENRSIYIPLGEVHRLENPGKIDTEIIEVQTGSYLGEDDIVRLEDVYNRS